LVLFKCDPNLFQRCIHFSTGAVLANNNIKQHNATMEVNEDDIIVNIDHSIPADTTDFSTAKGLEH
jgi:hypothetical protein